jgi:hypothetical protein
MKSKKDGAKARPRISVALVSQALNEAARDAVEIHKRAGVPLVAWKDGRPALVPADKVSLKKNGTKPRRRKS